MVGVSVGSIALNLLFKRLEYEKVAKYCAMKVREALIENGVKAKLVTLRSIYDNIQISGTESVKNVLNNATVFYYHDLDEKEPDLRYSKEILTVKELSKIKIGKVADILKAKEKVEVKGESCFSFLKKCCIAKENEDTTVKTQLKPEELMGIPLPEESFSNRVQNFEEVQETND